MPSLRDGDHHPWSKPHEHYEQDAGVRLEGVVTVIFSTFLPHLMWKSWRYGHAEMRLPGTSGIFPGTDCIAIPVGKVAGTVS